ncbi:MAG: DUF3100 domain-containing protein [Methanobrevibacter sp.]|nr:DUF3100 domain-containing protein [Methanobrevibacter sp.]
MDCILGWRRIILTNNNDKTRVTHTYRNKTDKRILKKNPWKDYGLHITVLVLVIIAMVIGPMEITLTKGVTVSIMPLLYTMVLGLACYLIKQIKWIGKKQSKVAEGAMMLFIGILIAKLAVSSGQSIHLIFEMGPALLLQELGHLATIFIALPVALILGFKREAIGMTNSIGREPEVAIVVDKYGFNSPESRGIFVLFIVGTIIGTVFISFFTSICVSLLPLHPYAFAMASGVGSASMNAASLGPTIAAFPALETSIEAFAGFSNLLSFSISLYIVIFVAIPLTEKLYGFLEPKIGRKAIVNDGGS